jgi:hypothetical protein
MADTLTRSWQVEQRIVSYTQWQSVWSLVQECERLAQHWQEQVNGLRCALRSRTFAGAQRAERQAILREAFQGLHQARAALTVLKTRLLRGCTLSSPDTHH